MPPKAKFSKDEIIDAAFSIVKEEGFTALTARSLGSKLGSSARPIFTVFQSMEEVQQEVMNASKVLYNQYIDKGLSHTLAFKGVGMQYIQFAAEEPKLFQILFMTEQSGAPNLNSVLTLIDENYKQILTSIQEGYDLDDSNAERLYKHLWIYTHGIATLCATKMCTFSKDEIDRMLTEICIGQIKEIKAGKNDD